LLYNQHLFSLGACFQLDKKEHSTRRRSTHWLAERSLAVAWYAAAGGEEAMAAATVAAGRIIV